MARKSDKVISYRRPFHWNIGIVVFLVVLLYLFIQVVSYLTREHIQIYEVGQVSTVVQDTNYTGLILRSEEIQNAAADGYLNIRIPDGDRAAAGETVCTIDATASTSADLTKEQAKGVTLTDSQTLALRKKLIGFSSTYRPSSFSSLYDMKGSLQSQLLGYYEAADSGQSTLSDGRGLSPVNTASSGVIEYYTDGLENLTEDHLTSKYISDDGYSRTMVSSGEKISSGTPVCKTITDETWYVYLPLSSEDQAALSEQNSITLLFHDANIEAKAGFSLYTASDGTILGKCELNDYMVELADKRYVSVTVEKSKIPSMNVSGLKIPKSAVVSQDFYIIPTAYAARGGNSSEIGFYEQTADGAAFVQPAIYAKTDDFYFVSEKDIRAGTVLLMPSEDQKVPEEGTVADEAASSAAVSAGATSASAEGVKSTYAASESAGSGSAAAEGAAETTTASAAAESSTAEQSTSAAAENPSDQTSSDAAGSTSAGSSYTIGETGSLQGVYTCNRGYTVFRRIDSLDENEDYLIIAVGTDYGVDVYDRIVLNGNMVQEGQMIY